MNVYNICDHCGNNGYRSDQCLKYWCTHCEGLQKTGTNANPLGHTKERCKYLLECGTCGRSTHTTEQCRMPKCTHCVTLKIQGINANPVGTNLRIVAI